MFGTRGGRGGFQRNDGFGEWLSAQSGTPRLSQSPRRGLSGRGFSSRGGYNTDWRAQRRAQAPSVNLLNGLNRVPIQTISDPSTANVDDIEAKDVQYLASYTWTNAKQPTMVVPGSPRVWRNRPTPYTVPPDSGITHAYSNSVKLPSSPLLPLFRAIDHMESSSPSTQVNWSSIDFITDRNNLRKLLSWIEHKDKGTEVHDFRIDLQLCGVGTVLMQRWEPRAIYAAENSGFGDSFERESTSHGPDCEDGMLTGHSRIISYIIHGMKIVLRCEVDAYMEDDAGEDKLTSTEGERPTDVSQAEDVSADDLADALSSLNVSASEVSSDSQYIKIISGGVKVPQASLMKIKTRSVRNVETFDWSAAYLQLFLGQTHNLYLGVHQRGTFSEVRKLNLETPEFQGAAKDMQPVLKKLGRLLDEILYIATDHGHEGRLSVVCQAQQLKIYKRLDKESFLPEDVLERFE